MWQNTVMAICFIVLDLMLLAAVAGLIIAILKVRKTIDTKIDQLMDKVQPILNQTQSIAEQAKETAEKVSEKVDMIMTRAETTVDKVGDKVDSIVTKADETANMISSKVDTVVVRATDTAQKVSGRFDTVTAKVEEAVTPRVTGPGNYADTAMKLLRVYRDVTEIWQSVQNTRQASRLSRHSEDEFEPHI